jgi:hypothetical protein
MSKAISSSDALLETQDEKRVDPVFKEIMAKMSPTPANRPMIIFKLRNAPNGKVHLDGIDDVFDPETKRMRRIRLIRGATTIWMDEQEKMDKEFLQKNRISITFVAGNLICDELKDEMIVKAARLMNANEGNRNRIPGKKRSFYEWDASAEEREAFEKELLEAKVVQLAMEQPFEKMKKHALYLNLPITNEMGQIRGEDGIRALYLRAAKADPEKFKESLDSKEVEYKYLIRRAIVDAKISVSTTEIKYPTGQLICRLPHGRESVDYLVEFAMLPTEESKSFVERLEKMAFN